MQNGNNGGNLIGVPEGDVLHCLAYQVRGLCHEVAVLLVRQGNEQATFVRRVQRSFRCLLGNQGKEGSIVLGVQSVNFRDRDKMPDES